MRSDCVEQYPSFWRRLFRKILRRPNYSAHGISEDLLSSGGNEQRIPKGKYTVPEFDFGCFVDPVEVLRTSGCVSFRSLRTGENFGWPYQVRNGNFTGSTRWSFDGTHLVVRGRKLFGHQVVQPVFQELVHVFSSTTVEGLLMATWIMDDMMHIKILNESGFVNLPLSCFSALMSLYRSASTVSSHSLSTYLRNWGFESSYADSVAVKLFHLVGGPKGTRDIRYFTTPMFTLESEADLAVPDEVKPYVSVSTPSVIEFPAVVPAMCLSSDLAAPMDRLYAINRVDVDVPEEIIGYADELSCHILGDNAPVEPWSYEDVIAAQKTAKTRERMLYSALCLNHHEVPKVDAFVKKEAYAEPKDLRNISAIAPAHNLEGFCFGLPLKKELFKKFGSYSPGRDPEGITQQILEHCRAELPSCGKFIRPLAENGNKIFLEGDFSRYDGRQTVGVRNLSFRIMRNLINPAHHKSFDEMVDRQFASRCYANKKIKYEHLGSMLSGAWNTTDGNTILTLLIMYSGLRRLGMTKHQAKHHIGLAFGDDSAASELENVETKQRLSGCMSSVAEELGLKLEFDFRTDNVFGYLSRYYHVEDGQIKGSIVDIGRLLPKFHLITRPDATKEDFRQKFSSLRLLAGENTPVLSAYFRTWFRVNGLSPLSFDELDFDSAAMPYWLVIAEDDGLLFPSPDSHVTLKAIEWAAQSLNVSVEDLLRLDDTINRANTAVELEAAYLSRQPAGVDSKFVFIRDHFVKEPPPRLLAPPPAMNPHSLRRAAQRGKAVRGVPGANQPNRRD